MGLPPNLNYLLSSFTSQDMITCQKQCNHIQKGAHTVSLRHGHTNTDRLCIHFPYSNPSSLGVVPNNLTSHAHVIPPSHIVFQDINRIKNAVTCTQTGRRDTVAVFSQDRREFVRVQTACAAGDNGYTFSLRAKPS